MHPSCGYIVEEFERASRLKLTCRAGPWLSSRLVMPIFQHAHLLDGDQPFQHASSRKGRSSRIFSALSTISTRWAVGGKFQEPGGVHPAVGAEAHRPAQHGGPRQTSSRALRTMARREARRARRRFANEHARSWPFSLSFMTGNSSGEGAWTGE